MKFGTGRKPITGFHASAALNIIMLLLIFILVIFSSIEWNGSRVKFEYVRTFDFSVASMNSLFIDSKERIYLGSDEVKLAELPARLGSIRGYLQRGFYVRSDKSVKLSLVMQVVEISRKLGIKNIILQTDAASY